MTRPARIWLITLWLACVSLWGADGAWAQELVVKRTIPGEVRQSCPPFAPPLQPSADQREAAGREFAAGTESAIIGDLDAARERFQRAAELDSTNPSFAYQLGRTLEDLQDPEGAAREYCRFVALAPEATEAADVQERLNRILPMEPAVPVQAALRFQTAVDRLDRNRLAEAEGAFDDVIRLSPGWADAYFNRGLIRQGRERSVRAARDFQRYLDLRPDAEDRDAVLARINALSAQGPRLSPSSALMGGLLIPGFGQFYTRRPGVGALVLGGVGGAILFGLRPEPGIDTIFHPLPFGEGTYPEEIQTTERPYVTAGIAAAAAIAAIGAIEAYSYARRRSGSPSARGSSVPRNPTARLPLPSLVATGEGVALQFTFPPP